MYDGGVVQDMRWGQVRSGQERTGRGAKRRNAANSAALNYLLDLFGGVADPCPLLL